MKALGEPLGHWTNAGHSLTPSGKRINRKFVPLKPSIRKIEDPSSNMSCDNSRESSKTSEAIMRKDRGEVTHVDPLPVNPLTM
jgi:hypothetical protein